MVKSHVPPRSRLCSQCKAPFVEGSSYYSLLDEELRHDYCKECIVGIPREKVIFWEGVIPVKEKQEDLAAFTLFKRLYGEEENKGLIYVLALYLERKKQLFRRVVKKELFFEEPIEGVVYKVEPTVLTEELKKEVVKLLQ